MRIMQIVSGVSVNGAVVTCLEVTRALLERGHAITLVCRPDAWIARQLGAADLRIVESDLSRWPLTELRRIAAIAAEEQIEVLHTHMSRANFFGVLLRGISGIPSVATANNRLIQLHWMFNDRVIAASEATAKFHRRFNFVRRSRLEVVHNFVDEERFRNLPAQTREGVRGKLGIDPAALLVGTVGDVVPRKGLLHLVRSLPRIVRAIPNTHLVSVGYEHKSYRQEVQRELAALGMDQHITWAGPRNDIPEILSALDLYVLPSLEDSLPLAILEAMASGLPVVASDVGGIRECVLSGETGRLVRPANPTDLAAAIIGVLADPSLRDRYGQAGRDRVHRHFSRCSQTMRMELALRRVAA